MKQERIIGFRKAPRFNASAVPSLKSVGRDEGLEIKLINISRGGALIETRDRILPGASISLKIDMTESVHIVRGRILRSRVHKVGKIMAYRIAIAFDEDFTVFPSGCDVD